MTSPISSPQNIFAIEQLSQEGNAPSWLTWFAVSLPVSIVAAILVWGLLLFAYPPNVKAVQQLPELKVIFDKVARKIHGEDTIPSVQRRISEVLRSFGAS